ncbi:MAG: nodulation protein NfeD [Woeseiaceae bacterium]|nr:nodulation protein NfeD [Woeseiaceae bacterium]
MKALTIFAALLLALRPAAAEAQGKVVILEVSGGIGVATADYILSGIEYAEEQNAELIVLTLDTPGGLVASMRDIVSGILNSEVPVATYVAPAGARADSAGTYILLASHVAAMAPTTHLGAATLVSLTGDDATPFEPPAPPAEPGDGADEPAPEEAPPDEAPAPGSAMERKVLNDAVSYIRGLAERHGRNADWAERAVREAATLTAQEALEENVIDVIAKDRAELLALIDGREVNVNNETRTLATADVTVEVFEPNWRIRILSVIAQPEIVLLLGLIGVYGLLFEGYNPGAIVPGVVGIICLLLAAYALQVLPVNYAGLALILVGLALMVAEAFAPSFGALGLGGIAAFVFGAILMFDSGIPGFGISLSFVIALALIAALFVIWVASYLVKLRNRGAVSGRGSIVGGIAIATESFTGTGRVWLEGEAWQARSNLPVQKDQHVVVRAIDGLVLDVEPLPASDAIEPDYQT